MRSTSSAREETVGSFQGTLCGPLFSAQELSLGSQLFRGFEDQLFGFGPAQAGVGDG